MTPPSTARVRAATADDAAALADVAAATFALACPPSTTEAAVAHHIATVLSVAAFESYLADPGRALLVADGRQGLDGYAMVVDGEPADAGIAAQLSVRPTSELSKIYVRADAHGSGVAGALMDAALTVARDRGAAGTWLGTNGENLRAQRFYAKQGFTVVGTRTFRLGDVDEHDLVYERALTG